MEHSVEKLSGNKVKISFKVPSAQFDEATDKAYLKMRGSVNVPGFRKGKAPRKLIERMYGESVFHDDALELLFPQAYMTAVQESGLKPVGRPTLDVQEMEKGKDLAFSCEIFVMPEITLGAYKGVEVVRKLRTISPAEVDSRIAQEQKRVVRSVDITDRALANGDKAELDYSGSVEGVKFAGGTAEHQTLIIGSNSFIPGFEEQMVGMNLGEERDLTVKFPDEYHTEELKGKDAIFHVKLHAITCEELPALDDEFAAEVSDFDTMAEYRADIEKKLQETAAEQADELSKQSMIDTIVQNATCEVPDPMVEDKLDDMMQQMGWRMQQQGFGLEQYLKMIGQTEDQMREMYRAEALSNVKSELVLNEIIKVEKFEADAQDVDKMLDSYAKSMNQTLEQLKSSFSEGQMDYFKQRARVNKAIDILWNSAKVTNEEVATDQAEATDEKPAVKRATKNADGAEA